MKIIVAPDSFKGSLSAAEAADYMEKGINKADPDITVKKFPMADGGEGTVETMVTGTGGRFIKIKGITGPLGEKRDSFFGILGDNKTAVIETAAAAGLGLVPPDKRNPLYTTTHGVGELMIEALNRGCKKIIIGLGGSATNDGGMGMAQAIGVTVTGKEGIPLGFGGKHLQDVFAIRTEGIDPRIKNTEIIAACDVTNTFYGSSGAARVFAPQKGADKQTVDLLDAAMKHFAGVIKKDLGTDISDIPGSGAAGGLGGGLVAFAGARMEPGTRIIIESCGIEEEIRDAALVITGEGRTDAQTVFGKVPVGIAAVAKKHNIPVVCISGGLGEGFEDIYNHGIDAAFSSVTDAMPLEKAMAGSGRMLIQTAFAVARLAKNLGSKNKN